MRIEGAPGAEIVVEVSLLQRRAERVWFPGDSSVRELL